MNELYHYGVLGMKWGIRRYQNKDGTLTEAGERRYNSSLEGGTIDRGRRLRAERKTKMGTFVKGAFRSHIIGKLFNKVQSVTVDKILGVKDADKKYLPPKYKWILAAFTAGKYAAKTINWGMTLRDISAMSKADKADKQETYIERKEKNQMEHSGTYLAHHGIKGQKWGVRRYQNEDGTLTEAGKQRYYDDYVANKGKMYDAWDRTGGQDGEIRKDLMKKKHKENLDEVIRIASSESGAKADETARIAKERFNEYQKAFFKKRKRAALNEANRNASNAYKEWVMDVVNSSDQYISTLPKDQQDIGRAYVYQSILGWDW